MLKFSFAIMATSLLIFSAEAQTANEGFQLDGKYDGPSKFIYMAYIDANKKQVVDSSEVKDGSFSFNGNINDPTLGSLYSKPFSGNTLAQIFLEPAKMKARINSQNFKDALIDGSASQKEWVEFQEIKVPVLKEMEPVSKKYNDANEKFIAARREGKSDKIQDSLKNIASAIQDEFEPGRAKMKKLDFEWFAKHPKSVVTAYYLRFYVSGLAAAELQDFYDKLGAATQKTSLGLDLEKELIALQGGSPGSVAKNFASTNINGKPMQLADFKGKYVLVDFWASWCVPCRAGNPHLKELYTKYKSKGFEVIGVSDDDRDDAAWKKAVAKDGLPWEQVLRGMKYDPKTGYDHTNDINDKFGIHTLPTQILIDPSGKIIARFGGGGKPHEELDQILASAIK